METLKQHQSEVPSLSEATGHLGPATLVIGFFLTFNSIARGALFRVLLALSIVAFLSRYWVQVASHYVLEPYLVGSSKIACSFLSNQLTHR